MTDGVDAQATVCRAKAAYIPADAALSNAPQRVHGLPSEKNTRDVSLFFVSPHCTARLHLQPRLGILM